MNKITPFLWFESQAEEAMNYYISIFKNSKVLSSNPQSVNFILDGQEFIGLNAGPQFKFNEAISFLVNCEDQDEVDYYWNKLIADGGGRIHVRLAQGQVWFVMADHPQAIGRADGRSRPRKSATRCASDVEDAEDHRGGFAEGARGKIALKPAREIDEVDLM